MKNKTSFLLLWLKIDGHHPDNEFYTREIPWQYNGLA